jgi:hypothetical protein
MRAELPAVAPALHLVASGRWRATLDAWPSWWRSRWSALVAGNEAQGLAHETAEQLAFLEAAELPDDAGEASAEQLAHEPPAGGRSELEHWPEWRREAWEELSARIEYVDGQPREPAERLAYLATAALPEPPPLANRSMPTTRSAPSSSPARPPSCNRPALVASLPAELQPEHAAAPPALALEECGHCHAVRLPRVTRCDLCGRRPWQTRQTEQPTAPPALALVPPPPPGTPTPPAELLTDDGARSLDPVGWWVVHPLACGGCGARGLADRGLGPCARCGWQKPPAERAALASRLAADPALCHRLASSP